MKNIFRNRKRIMCIILCCVTLIVSLYHAYDNAKEVQAWAVVDDIAYILMILAACGAGYAGYEWNASGGREEFENQLLEAGETLQRMWDETARKQASGDVPTGYDPDDFDPDNDDPNDKIPSWEKLKKWVSNHQGEIINFGATGKLTSVLAEMAPELIQTRENGLMSDSMQKSDITLPQSFKDNLKEYPYYIISTHHDYDQTEPYLSSIQMFKNAPAMYKNGTVTGVDLDYKTSIDSQIVCTSRSINYTGISASRNLQFGSEFTTNYVGDIYLPFWIYHVQTGYNFNAYSTNVPVYVDEASAISNCVNAKPVYPGTINPDSLPLSTDIMDWHKNNPDKDVLDKPLFDNIRIPTQEEIDKYVQDLENLKDTGDDDEEHKRVVVDEFIHNITNITEVPDPDPGPGPTPDPDPGPTPDPEPDPDLNPELEPGQLEFDFKLLFPFCVPFDLIDCIKVLDAEPVAPHFEIAMPYLTDKGLEKKMIDIDLSEYEDWALLIRRGEILLFLIGLILLTRNIIRG